MGDKPHTLDRTLSAPISWKEMFRTVSVSSSRLPSEPRTCKAGHSQKCGSDRKSELEKGSPRTMDSNRLKAMNFQLALYIAMAHAGLLLLILTLYGLSLLLRDFWKPIQWAVLCSITLREIQASLVRFWEAPLRKGLVQTAVAVPVAIFEGLVLTFHDAHVTLMWIVGKAPDGPVKVGFLKLLQWLVAFGVLTVGYEVLGPKSLATAVFTGLLAYAGFSVLTGDQGEVVSRQGRRRSSVTMKCLGWACWPAVGVFKVVNKRATWFVSKRLPTIIAVGLIVIMLLGSVAGLVIFTYKAGLETKDAIVALKDHVQQTNYTEMIGLKNWLENTNVPSLIEQHASTAYETVSYHIDLFGINYNLTEFTDAGKEYIISFARGKPNAISSNSSMDVSSHPVVIRLQNAKRLLHENNFTGIYSELEAAFKMLLEHFQLKPEDVLEKLKQVSDTGQDIGKRVFSGGTVLLSSGTYAMLGVASSIASGAAGIFNFLTQAAVFFSVLYYLITSESGGVMEQVLSMVPLSDITRLRCATVLNHAVSSVLLAMAKSAFFQASFTWLYFRLFEIHFLYVSTVLAIVTAVLPVLPHWIASVPAASQLALQGEYIGALILAVVHFVVVDFGNRAIHEEIPGHNAYLAALSIAGGMALFSPALEGAIMGPLLMTFLIALKNLYCEFVLNTEKNT